MCNRCGCNREFEERSCNRCNRCNDWNDGLYEAERINRQARERRCCENRCAHQFNHCMRNCRRCNNWD